MNIDSLIRYKESIEENAARYHIKRVYVFGSVVRGEGDESGDIDFLIEMAPGASALGVGGFQYEVQQLLGLHIDVVPTNVLSGIKDREFVHNIQTEAVAL